jgi:hypothetical protein
VWGPCTVTARAVLELDGMRFEVDPQAGGRVTSFSLGGFDVLAGADVDASSYGSTFWTSPQSDWGWPPPAEVDRFPYSLVSQEDTLTLTGGPSLALGVRVTKQFSTDRARGAMVLKYTIHNHGKTPRRYAPWEVSRVHARGLTFFPSGQPSTGPLAVERLESGTWFVHDPDVLNETGQKAFSCGTQGLLAHAAGGVLYVKSFPQVPLELQAPGEAEIEVYANNRYVEVEVQGPYSVIDPGASVTWTVRWSLRKIPPSIVPFPGNAELLAFATRVARLSAAPMGRGSAPVEMPGATASGADRTGDGNALVRAAGD